MVDSVAGAVVPRVVTPARTFALGVAGVVAHESGAAHQQVKQEAEHLHADGHQEEDERVPPLVLDQQLGEDARQRDDHPRCAWVRADDDGGGEGTLQKVKEMKLIAAMRTRVYVLSPVITPCVYLLGSIPM